MPQLHVKILSHDIVSTIGDCLNDITFSSVSKANVLIKGLQKIL